MIPKKAIMKTIIKLWTDFDDLPEDWECPVCASTKGSFEKE